MQLILTPMRRDTHLSLNRQGDVLTLNGEDIDLAMLPDGATLPCDAVASDWIAGDITRKDGVLRVPLVLPHGANAPEETRFATSISVQKDGPVALPTYDVQEEEAA
jgi:hypothetical protein